jgi:hypothetical protein
MADDPVESEPKSRARTKIAFDYLKTSQFRIVHADGAFGGPTPQGQMFISLYSERPPIPQRVVHSIEQGEGDAARVGKEIEEERVVRPAVVRDVEVGIIMSIAVAKALRDLLESRLKLIEEL